MKQPHDIVLYGLMGAGGAAGYFAARKSKIGPVWGVAIGAGAGAILSMVWWAVTGRPTGMLPRRY